MECGPSRSLFTAPLPPRSFVPGDIVPPTSVSPEAQNLKVEPMPMKSDSIL